MADLTISPGTYPAGTSVKAYPVTNWPGGNVREDADPLGTETATVVADATGAVAFTGLTAGTRYVTFATVGGVRRYVSVLPGAMNPLSELTADTDGTLAANADSSVATQKATKTYADAVKAANAGAYRNLLNGMAILTTAAASGTTYALTANNSNNAVFGNVTNTSAMPGQLLPLVASQLAVAGLTTKLAVYAQVVSNGTPPAVTYTIGLYPITIVAATFTAGTVVAGSTAAIASPAANAVTPLSSGDFTLPSDGPYALGLIVSGTPSANVSVYARVLARNV